jgi:ADP-ribose pyrophosphatase YjhB (NUDIX family)
MSAPPAPAPSKFARYRPTPRTIRGRRFWAVPEGGVCLSAFVLLRPRLHPNRVLLGRPDPGAPWEEMATLEEAHVRSIGERWILPASHLREFESPADAAGRIVRQQLGIAELPLQGPDVFSEVYPSLLDPESGPHWDIHFVFRGEWSSMEVPPNSAWREMAFLDPLTMISADIARGHADILALAGFQVGRSGSR